MRITFGKRSRAKRLTTERVRKFFVILVVGVFFIGTDSVLAQRVLYNNNNHIPDSIRNLVSSWDRSPGGYCAGTRINSQHIWLSPPNNARTAGVLTMERGSTSLPVWFNAVATNCLANVRNDGTGRVINQDLKHTRYNLQSASATITPTAPGSLSVSLPGTPGGDARSPLLNYQVAYDVSPPHLRYIKNWGSRDSPAHHVQLTLSGSRLSNLPVGDYTVRVTASAKLVNHFHPPGRDQIYECVSNSGTFTNNTRDGLNRCASASAPASFTLRVRENWAGRCNVTLRAGTSTPLVPGQRFGVRFSTTNAGIGAWADSQVAMRRQGTTTPRWQINDNFTPGRLIPFGDVRVLQPETNTMWNTSATAFTAPDRSETWTFDLVKHGGSPTLIMNTCTLSLVVEEEKEPVNRPYLHINGGDVYSGASFRNADCTPTAAASNSRIQTNGFSDEGDPGSSRWQSGTSQSQYAVFASGEIGNGTSQSTNTFLGNYGFSTRARTGSSMHPLRDVLFANQGDYRGSYFAGSGAGLMPCVGDALTDAEAVIAAGDAIEATSGNEIINFLNSDTSGTIYHQGDVDVNMSGLDDWSVNIPSGTQKNVVVINGRIEIIGNIRYPSNYSSVEDVPYVQLIAQGGNIYLNHFHARWIDAHLMAVPSDDSPDSGVIDTCAGAPPSGVRGGEWQTPILAGSCYKLPTPGIVINGSLAARRVLWKHTSGTLGQAGEYITSIPGMGGVCSAGVDGDVHDALSLDRYRQCAAELVTLYPETHLRHFREDSPTTYGNVPVLTKELPPIF